MTEAKFEGSFLGIAAMLKSPMIAEMLLARAEEVKARAEELAPVSETSSHPGRYKAAFHTRTGYNVRRSRVEAVVYNDAPEAIDVEKGNSHQDGQHVLIRALDILRRL